MAVVNRVSDHIQEVQRVAEGIASERDAAIAQSWQRCVSDYQLDPLVLQEAYIVPHSELKEHQERLDKLLNTARYGLNTLYRQIAQHGYVILLTDADGVTVDFQGDRATTWELRKSGLFLGAEWSEARAGTCGVGSCIYTGEAITVHQTDHFDATHAPLSCTAAPIYDVDGSLAAVLDISALQSPEPKSGQALALSLVQSCTRRIEMAALMNTFRRDWIVRLSQSPAFLDVDPECAIAVNSSGEIIGMTHSAQRLLAHIHHTDWRNPSVLLGSLLSEYFHLHINELPTLSRALPTEERLISTRSGELWFAHALAPQQLPLGRRKRRVSSEAFACLYQGDRAMERLAQQASQLSLSSLPLLLTGETGSGKEYLARAIHQSSPQKNGTFVAINCAAIPESLIESELFGYADGAFTGARGKGKKGLIEQADGGTLFLDEIGDMPLSLQARLLRVLAESEVLPVGATKAIPVSLRVLAATHQDLSLGVQNGRFREDLFYRISGARLAIPPLRARKDIVWLATKLVEKSASKPMVLSASVQHLFNTYSWPGNIRELDNTIRFALAFCLGSEILPEHLPEDIQGWLTRGSVAENRCDSACVTDDILSTLETCHWNISETARVLGVDRSTVHRRIKKAGLSRHYRPS
ncbi:sigma-54-dependent Fis family transcriptional regulator [Enterovibrio norvegicus]|uniref:sigma-54-dependent Fis family transcriptional regulator n=1 Tax=Enterovibrio norvegicus TaxID=188144 RepID=UPI0003117ED0|nr:sigma-54-dependent Fis family transcriptional regulator [Enterovibrio norvegicus]MCC4798816.1 sigma-54-dependent Fis family transcriptional regulator [Enterovibrio norvegicus]OEF57442.1 sigma-54-dependent Fis family transcriptional regulator [Enterovibrio norvegicus]PMI28180.1 sigma-54-dependent Fis family transcriptional regulator [Enterovibrio norvegicus]PMI35039.1 sigma-54-dependent Fis family transcriptional regulator [Enterovibrio norvegicus]PMN46289.1 sigma-54-dependent Fis family tra